MQTILLSCLFGTVCVMGSWAAVSARATIDEMLRRGARLSQQQEP
jgi:hypothetical protein